MGSLDVFPGVRQVIVGGGGTGYTMTLDEVEQHLTGTIRAA